MLPVVNVEFDAELWIWQARREDGWTFVSLPEDESEEIRAMVGPSKRGFGAVRVRVMVGATTWRTSIFPGGGDGPYVLPIKGAVRKAENVTAGDTVHVRLEVLI
jgi:hypothetical protein